MLCGELKRSLIVHAVPRHVAEHFRANFTVQDFSRLRDLLLLPAKDCDEITDLVARFMAFDDGDASLQTIDVVRKRR
jgi:hypothetical protein